MQLGRLLGKLIGSQQSFGPREQPAPAAGADRADAGGGADRADTIFGVKYTSRYSWQILPPAGWQRQESNGSAAWPASGISLSVSFVATGLPAGESAMIRWQIGGTPASESSHEKLERLLRRQEPLTAGAVRELSAPGMVSSMRITEVDLTVLPGGLPALIVSAGYLPLKGEEPLMRYVLILPDRAVLARHGQDWYRETLQYVASENSFWTKEKQAVQSMRTFRRGDGTGTADQKGFVSGSYPVFPATTGR